MSENKIPEVARAILDEYVFNLRIYFGSKVFGVYLYNSIALGAFDENKSDIDFVTVLNKRFTDREIQGLRELHRKLTKTFKFAKRMEGMYITIDEVGKCDFELDPYIYFAGGKLHSGHYDANYVTWWTLGKYGIGVESPDISKLSIETYFDNVLENMDYNLNCYWKSKLNSKIVFFSDGWIEFSVLTMCRIMYTIKNGDVASKVEAAKNIIEDLPKEFRIIVKEALRIRERSDSKSLYTSRFKRGREAKIFIKYVIGCFNNNYFTNVKWNSNV
ncbi:MULTISPECIES: aminoglycoside adenylyltransferase domain-containing protein [Clostridium]|uniref:aminoglycoside adenylyltransferase domain-containing protein n=1 Tax=Clostridium TaxID=1485 RepID=UPI00069DF25C|nr:MULTISPECIES: aminoglycoside adenylyltransferase domain-containing protein [Clostridium]KOF56015.1 hypothetical protein AGR56_03255 [Clostridium sp. DMHC 10]MCD2345483.1 DUF4111 domain-containing protein [Clostridium guangxiense]